MARFSLLQPDVARTEISGTGNFRFVVCRVKPKSAHAPLCTLINIRSECIISACSGFVAMSRPKVPETQPSPCVSVNQGGCSVSVVMLICACANIDLTTNLKFPVSWLRSRCLTNPCQSNLWWLTTARRNSYQPVLVRICRNCAIWRRGFLPRRGF